MRDIPILDAAPRSLLPALLRCGAGGGCVGGGCDRGGGGVGGGGCACGAVVVPGALASATPSLALLAWRHVAPRLAHHPDTEAFREDVLRVGATRLCVGCFTVYPVFLGALWTLAAGAPDAAWWGWLAIGAALSTAQGVSSAGRARRRSHKIAVKSALGLGLAMVVHGTRVAPWPDAAKVALLVGVLALAALSARRDGAGCAPGDHSAKGATPMKVPVASSPPTHAPHARLAWPESPAYSRRSAPGETGLGRCAHGGGRDAGEVEGAVGSEREDGVAAVPQPAGGVHGGKDRALGQDRRGPRRSRVRRPVQVDRVVRAACGLVEDELLSRDHDEVAADRDVGLLGMGRALREPSHLRLPLADGRGLLG